MIKWTYKKKSNIEQSKTTTSTSQSLSLTRRPYKYKCIVCSRCNLIKCCRLKQWRCVRHEKSIKRARNIIKGIYVTSTHDFMLFYAIKIKYWMMHFFFFHSSFRMDVSSPTPSDQQYALRWNDFQSSILSSFRHLRDEEDFVDVTLACDQRSFTAHKVKIKKWNSKHRMNTPPDKRRNNKRTATNTNIISRKCMRPRFLN